MHINPFHKFYAFLKRKTYKAKSFYVCAMCATINRQTSQNMDTAKNLPNYVLLWIPLCRILFFNVANKFVMLLQQHNMFSLFATWKKENARLPDVLNDFLTSKTWIILNFNASTFTFIGGMLYRFGDVGLHGRILYKPREMPLNANIY